MPEPENPHDSLAVRVTIRDGRQIGYLPALLWDGAVAKEIHDGAPAAAVILEIENIDVDAAPRPPFPLGVEIEVRWRRFHDFSASNWKLPGE